MFHRISFFILFLISLQTERVYADIPKWAQHALELSGDGLKIRNNAIRQLKNEPELNSKLESALADSSLRPLAIDVLIALKIKSANSYLLEHLHKEPDGLFVLALNSLLDPPELFETQKTYLNHLHSKSVSLPIKIAILDSFERTAFNIPSSILSRMAQQKNPDFDRAFVSYLRVKSQQSSKYLQYLFNLYPKRHLQTRLQIAHVFAEHKTLSKDIWKKFLKICIHDSSVELSSYCANIAEETKP